MSGNVVKLGNHTLPGESNPELVELLEHLLERARDGDIVGFAYCTVGPSQEIGTGWSGGDGTRWPLFAGTNLLNIRFAQKAMDK